MPLMGLCQYFVGVLACCLLFSALVHAEPTLDERVHEIASELRCVVCQNLSVADSPSAMAGQMRGIVREQLEQGKSAAEIKAYFVSKYGDWVLLAPPRRGFSLIVWILPFAVLVAALLCAGWVLYRWSRKRGPVPEKPVDPVLLERVREELANRGTEPREVEDPFSRAKNRIYEDIEELEFDFQAGKISREDYEDLRGRYENQAASLLAEEPRRATSPDAKKTRPRVTHAPPVPVAKRGWVLAVGGAVLVAGGIAVGLLLGESLKPRMSSEDSMTGDFLTGTDNSVSGPNQLNELLDKGRRAFENRDVRTAINSFKEVLASDPANPMANAYMGLILAQAGHSDAALLALDRALAGAPRLPMALWAKGMILYRDKRDLDGAKRNLTALVQMLPAGEERDAIQGMIAQIEKDQASPERERPDTGPSSLAGTIRIDPKLEANVDPGAVLFIIARKPGAERGPPLAVKKVPNPAFPVAFSLGEADVMMPGTRFDGSVDLFVRLDLDGNPMTREPGSLIGAASQNPVPVGTQDLQITIDQLVGE